MKTTEKKIARATHKDGMTFDVTYPGTRDFDNYVGWDYLRALSKSGYEVHIAPWNGEPADIIPASSPDAD